MHERAFGVPPLLLGLACSGCYAGVGPTLGTAGGSPTLGWEASAATVTVGQSFATDSEPTLAHAAKPHDYAFVRRTYLLWEPRIGIAPRADRDDAFSFGGGGASIGMRWDRVAGATGDARSHFGALGGAFFGGGRVFEYGASRCDTSLQPYVSLAIGVRGGEIYLAPKGGVVGVPHFCFTITSFGGW
jgi:hypothetical protein